MAFMKLVVCVLPPHQSLVDIKTLNFFYKYHMK